MEFIPEGFSELAGKIEKTADLFYQQKSQEGYRALISIIDDLTTVSVFLDSKKDIQSVREMNQRLAEKLSEVMNAMLEKDTVLIADILKYDIIDSLNEIVNYDF